MNFISRLFVHAIYSCSTWALEKLSPGPIVTEVRPSPMAWFYELAQQKTESGYENWIAFVSLNRPTFPEGSVRNVLPLISGVLTSEDGKFMVHHKQAIQDSYLLNCAEGAIMRSPRDKQEIAYIMGDYCSGDITWDKAMERINEDIR